MEPNHTDMQSLPPSYSPKTQPDNDEIDLMEIVILLWKEKFLIIITSLFLLIPTMFWISLRPPSYSIDVLIDNVSPHNFDSLQPSILMGKGSEHYQLEKFDKSLLFQKILHQLETLHLQKLFWESWSKQPLSADPQQVNTENDIAFMQFSRNLSLTKPDPKKTEATVSKVTLTTIDPASGVELLNAYVQFLNNYATNQVKAQMEASYKASLEQLQLNHAQLTNHERVKLHDKLILLNEQLNLAKSLNIIDTPYDKLSGIELTMVDNRLYMFGTKALLEEIKVLKARQELEPSIFVKELRDMEFWRKTMEDDLQKLETFEGKFNIFEIVSSPEPSLEAVGPKKLIIILGVLFLSVIIGVILVIIKQGIKNHQLRHSVTPH